MPRQGRVNIEGGIYHVIQRGLERREIFRDDFDRKEFLRRLEDGLKETNHKCYGWALMPNHFHLLLRLSAKHLSDLMRGLLTGYALYFNKKYKRSGYLYQNRYKSILCQEDEYFLALVRYIHLNPLKAQIVKDMDQLNNYKWSGHSVIIGRNVMSWQSVDEVLAYFGNKKLEAVRKYLEFITGDKDSAEEDIFDGGGLRRSSGGWSQVLALRVTKEYRCCDERILGGSEFVSDILKTTQEEIDRKERLLKEGWGAEKVASAVAEIFQINKEEIYNRSRLNSISTARKVFMYFGKKELGLSGREIGRYLGITEAAVSKGIREGERQVRENNIKLIS